MSASREILCEKIRFCESQIEILESTGGDSTQLREDLEKLKSQFAAVNKSLNEGKLILKG